LIERKAGHCVRGVFADAGKLSHLLNFPWEVSAIWIHNGFGCGVEISRASVITEPLPCPKYLIFRSARQCTEIGKPAQPFVVIRDDGGDLRLLEHELGNEDCVRVARAAPRELAAVTTMPAEKRSLESAYGLWGFHDLKANVQRPTLNVQLSIQKVIEH
jgi:hypothetical protein